ncbi:prefoldin subunit 6 [Auriculariales sp. MPI-PUGE-AT-0066]|nr:prefoldin subunit 6 [Auriculariales sp. MPI-PUGE-AT-0066]
MSDDALQAASTAYNTLQTDISAAVDARTRLESQHAENQSVKREFGGLKAHNTVYKLIGAVLVEQDQAEARSTVDKRLEFIAAEIKRVESQINDLSEKSEAKKNEIATLQMQRQQQQAPQQQAVAAA